MQIRGNWIEWGSLILLALAACGSEVTTDSSSSQGGASTTSSSGEGGSDESSIGGNSAFSTGSDGGSSGSGGSTSTATACPIEGSWVLTTFICGDVDITVDWLAVVSESILIAEESGEGCAGTQTNSNDSCTEVIAFTAIAESTETLAVDSDGIVSCDPTACTFAEGDEDPCEIGDRAGSIDMDYVVDENTLTLTFESKKNICAKYGLSPTIQILTKL